MRAKQAKSIVTALCVGALLLLLAAMPTWAQSPLKCDVNGDRIIDGIDLGLILAARNHAVSGPQDPRDADTNGRIDAVDVRICHLRCMRPGCSTRNSAPIANAGPDQSAVAGATVQLTGAASTDIDGPNPLTYTWTLTTRPVTSLAALANPSSVNPTFAVDVVGNYGARLIVSDGVTSSVPDDVVISTSNSAPTANAGPDQTRKLGDTVVLTGAASSDPDGNSLAYFWSMRNKPAQSRATLANSESVHPSFVIDVPGVYAPQLIVSDSHANSAADVVVISTTNTIPVAGAGPDQSVFIGDTVTLNGTGSTDVDGDPIAFAWTLLSRPSGSTAVLAGAASAFPSFVVDVAGSYSAQLIVNDGFANSVPDTVAISTGNSAPVAHAKASCAALPNTDCGLPIGSIVGLDGSASTDVDGNGLTYAWSLLTRPSGSAASLATPTAVNASFTTDAPGDFIVQLIVNDGTVNSVPRTLKVTSTNVAPTALATVNPINIPALPRLVQLDGGGSADPENQGLTYAWSLLARPAGSTASLSSATTVNPTFTADLLGTYTAQLIVSDGFLSSTPVTVSASTVNQPPGANAGPDQSVVAGSTAQLTSAGSSDPEGAPLGYFWSLLSKPAGSSADFVGNANAANPTFLTDRKGSYVAQLIVNDGLLFSVPDTVQVTATNRAPLAVGDSFTIGEDGTLVVDGVIGVLANDTDADGDPLTAIVVGATPLGLTFNANGGFTYTPLANFNGTTTFQYKANDGSADSNTVSVAIDVTPVNDAPTANAGPDQNLPAAGLVQLNGAASSDPEGQPLSYAWTLISVPPGSAASLGSATSVNPTFTADLGGTYVAQLIVADGALPSPPATVTITVAALPAVTIVATDPAASEIGPDPGAFTVTRTGSTVLAMIVNFTRGGTANVGLDYVNFGGEVTIPAGQSSATITVTPAADILVEPAETLILTLAAGPDYAIGAPNSATVTIADEPATVTIVATDPVASEIGSNTGMFTVTRTGGTSLAMIVNFNAGGTANVGLDYVNFGGEVTIPAGQSSATITVAPAADILVEADETLILTLTPSINYLVGSPGSATVTIADDPATMTIVATDPVASESGPDAGVFTVTRTGGTSLAMIVNFTVSGTATVNLDYADFGGQVTIPAGQSSATISFTPFVDALVEADETVILTLSATPANYLVGAPSSATVTIAATDANAAEAGPDAGAFTIAGTGPTTAILQVSVSVGGTASNVIDYQEISSVIIIPAGQASVTVPLTPLADAGIEPAETAIESDAVFPGAYALR